jgi:hypothetical protein
MASSHVPLLTEGTRINYTSRHDLAQRCTSPITQLAMTGPATAQRLTSRAICAVYNASNSASCNCFEAVMRIECSGPCSLSMAFVLENDYLYLLILTGPALCIS